MQCPTGSTVKAGAPAYFQFDSVTVSGFLPFASALAWLGFLNLPVGPVSTTEFCSKEPPATTMSPADWLALGVPPIAAVTGVYGRLADWIQQNAFSQYCACTGASGSAYSAYILSLSPRWWHTMGQAGGATVLSDASGNSRPGTASATSAVFGQTPLITGDPANSVQVVSTGALAHNLSATADTWNGSQDNSCEFWIRIAAHPSVLRTVYTTYGGVQGTVALYVDTSGHILLQAKDSAGAQTLTTGTKDICDNVVHQIDIVLDHAAHTLKVYVDAVTDVTTTVTTNSYYDGSGAQWLLTDPHSTTPPMVGYAAHWSWFARALTAAQIADLKAAAGSQVIYAPQPYIPPTGGTPPAGTPPTCSTSQDVCTQLYQTNLLLQGLSSQLTMLKARAEPSFWLTGNVHTGLTGTGVITVSDILALNVLLTTVPGGWGATAETPRRLIPAAGSIQAGFAAQYTDNWQLHYENQIVLLEAAWAVQVRYNLKPGVVATIIELVPSV